MNDEEEQGERRVWALSRYGRTIYEAYERYKGRKEWDRFDLVDILPAGSPGIKAVLQGMTHEIDAEDYCIKCIIEPTAKRAERLDRDYEEILDAVTRRKEDIDRLLVEEGKLITELYGYKPPSDGEGLHDMEVMIVIEAEDMLRILCARGLLERIEAEDPAEAVRHMAAEMEAKNRNLKAWLDDAKAYVRLAEGDDGLIRMGEYITASHTAVKGFPGGVKEIELHALRWRVLDTYRKWYGEIPKLGEGETPTATVRNRIRPIIEKAADGERLPDKKPKSHKKAGEVMSPGGRKKANSKTERDKRGEAFYINRSPIEHGLQKQCFPYKENERGELISTEIYKMSNVKNMNIAAELSVGIWVERDENGIVDPKYYGKHACPPEHYRVIRGVSDMIRSKIGRYIKKTGQLEPFPVGVHDPRKVRPEEGGLNLFSMQEIADHVTNRRGGTKHSEAKLKEISNIMELLKLRYERPTITEETIRNLDENRRKKMDDILDNSVRPILLFEKRRIGGVEYYTFFSLPVLYRLAELFGMRSLISEELLTLPTKIDEAEILAKISEAEGRIRNMTEPDEATLKEKARAENQLRIARKLGEAVKIWDDPGAEEGRRTMSQVDNLTNDSLLDLVVRAIYRGKHLTYDKREDNGIVVDAEEIIGAYDDLGEWRRATMLHNIAIDLVYLAGTSICIDDIDYKKGRDENHTRFIIKGSLYEYGYGEGGEAHPHTRHHYRKLRRS